MHYLVFICFVVQGWLWKNPNPEYTKPMVMDSEEKDLLRIVVISNWEGSCGAFLPQRPRQLLHHGSHAMAPKAGTERKKFIVIVYRITGAIENIPFRMPWSRVLPISAKMGPGGNLSGAHRRA